jgi:uncharacterized membrane protein
MRLAGAAAVGLLPPLAYHLLIVAQGASTLVVVLGWLGTGAALLVAARIAGAGAAGTALLLAAFAVAWLAARDTDLGLYFAPVATWLVLLALFARTLLPGREPLVARVARICHDAPLPPDMARYARGATVAWSLFFATIAGALALGAALLPLETWSLAANVGAAPLVAAMFAAEYAVRVRRFPGFPHVHPLAMAARLGRAGWRLALADG